MCIHHFTYHLPCGHYLPNLTHSTNTHCTSLQHSLFTYHDQPDLTTNSTQPASPHPLPPPTTCPPIPPLQHLHLFNPHAATYIPSASLPPHPSPAAEHRAYRAWGRFHARDELNYFFFLASGFPARATGRYTAANLPGPPSPPTAADEPTMQDLANRYDHPPGAPNVQVTPVYFGCGQGWGPYCGLGRGRWAGGFSEGELERAVEEEEGIVEERARRAVGLGMGWGVGIGGWRGWLPREGGAYVWGGREEELVVVGGGAVVRRGDLVSFFKGLAKQGRDVVVHLRAMAEAVVGERGLVNGVVRRGRRGSFPEMEVRRADGRGRSYSV